MKQDVIRSLYISSIISVVTLAVIFGFCVVYRGTREVGYGEKKSAVERIYDAETDTTKIRIWDFEINL